MRGALVIMLLLLPLLPASAAPAPTPAAQPRVVRIVMDEYAYHPAAVTLKAGERVRLELVNAGAIQHQFRSSLFRGVDVYVRTPGFDTRSERMEVVYLRPRTLVTLEFSRKTPGEYDYWCSERAQGKRHRDLGMRGKFVVTP